MKVLVTGHDGYIGCVLTPMLREAGHEVVGLDNFMFHDCRFPPFAEPSAVPEHSLDVRDVTAEHLEGIDAIAHLAGISNDPLGNLDPDITFAVNHRASIRLAELAKAAGVGRFVFSSSCSNYGAASDELLTEESAFNPVTPYGESKVFVERDLKAMADDSFSPVYLRNATVYGASPRLRGDLVVNNLTGYAFTTGTVLLKSAGTSWRPLLHVRDCAKAFLTALEAPREKVHDQAFNVGSTEENYRIRDVAEIVASVVPSSKVAFADGAEPDVRNYNVRCDKIRDELGYQTEWTVLRGVEELYAAYQKLPLELEDLEGPRFLRIRHVIAAQKDGELDPALRMTRGSLQ